LNWHALSRIAATFRVRWRTVAPLTPTQTSPGISVVIPSRNGRHLLEVQLPGIVRDLAGIPSEIIVSDNGSDDGTAAWLHAAFPQAVVDVSAPPLSFARAVNRGIARARYSHVCLLNNDMILEPGFFTALQSAFTNVPDLFCATAQIFFPAGIRREETGKAVYRQPEPKDFPIRCDNPLPGEDLTWVLYGSGGCSLYDTAKLRALGGMDEIYDPAYVEDLDIGYRAWQLGWSSVYVAGAKLEHRHRATTTRYYTQEQLDRILEINYLRFVARAVADQRVFRTMWQQAIDRLSGDILRAAPAIALAGGLRGTPQISDDLILALGNGAVAVFPGGAEHGPIYQILCDTLQPPPPELLAGAAEVTVVSRAGGELAWRAALMQTKHKWTREIICQPDILRF
jgi:GT2 family glycosyltransferase